MIRDALLVCITLIASMIGFYLIEAQNYVKASDVKAIIEDKQAVVVEQVSQLKSTSERLEAALLKATEAINDLRVELAKKNGNT